MNRLILTIATGALVLGAGFDVAVADNHGDAMVATPAEIFTCKYNEGKGPADMQKTTAKFNAWADKEGITDYSAWSLVPYYANSNQDFDVIWLGGASSAASLGAIQDKWLATGGKIEAEFQSICPTDAHGNFATLQFMAPPESDNPPNNVVIAFSDCNMADGVSFGKDVAPALAEWAEYKAENDSTGGIWIMFPAYGGGGEEFDFKYVTGHRNLEEQGKDWDQYTAEGRIKAAELFDSKVDCDSSRVYLATRVRTAAADE
ncbi:MAG: hypothetical protein HKN77_03005 [Woeseiaceae bacterium]|nr:hypothetical protein [Woeseiaceae bacterium]